MFLFFFSRPFFLELTVPRSRNYHHTPCTSHQNAGFCLCLHLVCLLSRHIQDILCVLNLNHILSYYTYFKRSTINFFKSSNESVRSFTLFSIPAILRSCSLVCLNAGLISSNIDSQASILARWASTLSIIS